jgi:hypothetical protein
MVVKFPKEIAQLICQYCAQWTVLPWVEEYAPKTAPGEDDDYVPCEVSYESYLFANPLAKDLIEARGLEIHWGDLSRNPAHWAVELLETRRNDVDPGELCRNTNPRAIKMLENFDPSFWDRGYLLANPAAMHLFAGSVMDTHPSWLMWNPNGEALIKAHKVPIDYPALAGNSASWAVEMMKQYPGEINWVALCANRHTWAIEKIREQIRVNPGKICWANLSANPAAIDILKANRDKITIEIWENEAIFELTVSRGFHAVIMSI